MNTETTIEPFIEMTKQVPNWNDGLCEIILLNGKKSIGRYNEVGEWFRCPIRRGIAHNFIEGHEVLQWRKLGRKY